MVSQTIEDGRRCDLTLSPVVIDVWIACIMFNGLFESVERFSCLALFHVHTCDLHIVLCVRREGLDGFFKIYSSACRVSP